jgi:RNase P subunit RPR2
MEILSRGQLPEDKTYEGSCHNCHTHVRFKKREAEYIDDQRDGDCVKVNCPVCGHAIYVDAKLGR